MAVLCRRMDHDCRVKRHNIVMTKGVGKVRAVESSEIDEKNSVGLKEHDAKFEFGFGGIKAKHSMLRAAQSTKRQSPVSRVSFAL